MRDCVFADSLALLWESLSASPGNFISFFKNVGLEIFCLVLFIVNSDFFCFVFQPCDGTGIRDRSAVPIRQAEEGKACHIAAETEPCTLNKNCFHYEYNVTGMTPIDPSIYYQMISFHFN